jgi:hypothetical protein
VFTRERHDSHGEGAWGCPPSPTGTSRGQRESNAPSR